MYNPHYVNRGVNPKLVSAAVSSSASARAAGFGPFKGLYIQTSTDFTVANVDASTSTSFTDVPKGSFFWIEGEYLSAIATATAIFALK